MAMMNPADRAELQDLRDATAALAADVQSLTGALEQNYAKKTEVTEAKGIAAQAAVTSAVSAQNTAKILKKEKERRKVIVARFMGFAVVLTAFFAGVSVVLVNAADDANQQTRIAEEKAKEYRAVGYQSCLARNQQALRLARFLSDQIEIEKQFPTRSSEARIKSFTALRSGYPVPDCSRLKVDDPTPTPSPSRSK